MPDQAPGPPGADAEDDLRARRREVARRHHPDVGGDAETFAREMARLSAPAGTDRPAVEVRATRRGRLARTVGTGVRDVVATVRHRLPRSFPGSRRYGRL